MASLARAGVLLAGLLAAGPFVAAQAVGWTNLQPATSPPFRATEGLAWEPFTGLVVAFGGSDSTSTVLLNDTWIFDGASWTQLFPGVSPSGRLNVYLARSPTPGRLVLFGGGTGAGVVDGATWEFDFALLTWILMTPPGPSPSPRQLANMVYDSARGRTVLFGGTNGGGAGFQGDTWEWDGTAWTNVSPAVGPSARGWHSMTYDSVRGRTVLFGGYNGVQLGDTWEWDGSAWLPKAPPVSPPARSSGAIAYDATSRRVVLFGGSYGWPTGLNDTWYYDGLNWYPAAAPATVPPPQYLHRMVEAPTLGGILVYGAFGNGWAGLNETWLHVAPAVTAVFTPFGVGCAGSAGVPVLSAAPGQVPLIGSTLTVDFTSLPNPGSGPVFAFLGLSRTFWGPLALPHPLAAIGMPGCSVFVEPAFAAVIPSTAGIAALPLAIPNSLALEGAQFFVQGLVPDVGANPFGATVTSAGECTVGSR